MKNKFFFHSIVIVLSCFTSQLNSMGSLNKELTTYKNDIISLDQSISESLNNQRSLLEKELESYDEELALINQKINQIDQILNQSPKLTWFQRNKEFLKKCAFVGVCIAAPLLVFGVIASSSPTERITSHSPAISHNIVTSQPLTIQQPLIKTQPQLIKKVSQKQEDLEQERLEKEQAHFEEEQRLLKQERLEQERREKEQRLEQDRFEEEQRVEQERLKQSRLEQEHREEEQRLEQERLKQEYLKKERLERERLEKERLEKERSLKAQQQLEEREKERLKREKREQIKSYIKDHTNERFNAIKEMISEMHNDKTPRKIKLVTFSTPNRDKFSLIVASNQIQYAKKFGYGFVRYTKSFDINRPEEWSKIKALLKEMKTSKAEWLLWIDDDIMITNPQERLESFINQYGSGKNIIIAEDACARNACKKSMGRDVPINNGIFFIRNNEWSKNFLEKVWKEGYRRGLLTRGRSLLEQDTMTFLMNEDQDIKSKIVILEQRKLNSFLRDPEKYPEDQAWSKWQAGDFAAHVTGMPEDQRTYVIDQLDQNPHQKPRFDYYNYYHTSNKERQEHDKKSGFEKWFNRISESKVWDKICDKIGSYSKHVIDNTPSYKN